MKCTSCQSEIESGSLYCPKCGKPIQLVPNYNELEEELLSKIVEDKDAEKDKFATGVYKAIEEDLSTNIKPVDKQVEKTEIKPKKEINKLFIIIPVIIVVFIIVGISINNYVRHVNSFDYLLSTAEKLEEKESYTDAVDYYKKAVEIDPSCFEAVFGLGKMYYYANEYKASIDALNSALELDPDNISVYEYIVQCYLALDDKQSVYELYNNSINDDVRNLISGYIVTPPTLSVPAGEYNEEIEVEMSSDKDYEIFYTTDGKDPTKYGQLYKEPVKLESGEHTIKAVCKTTDGQYSYVISYDYTINIDIPPLPEVSQPEGQYVYPLCLTVSVPEGYACFYTTDNSTPTAQSAQYTDMIVMPYGTSYLSVVYMSSTGVFGPVYTGTYTCLLEGEFSQ